MKLSKMGLGILIIVLATVAISLVNNQVNLPSPKLEESDIELDPEPTFEWIYNYTITRLRTSSDFYDNGTRMIYIHSYDLDTHQVNFSPVNITLRLGAYYKNDTHSGTTWTEYLVADVIETDNPGYPSYIAYDATEHSPFDKWEAYGWKEVEYKIEK